MVRCVQKKLSEMAYLLAGLVVLSVPIQLPNNLESLFRRGGDFDTGFELIAALQLAVSPTNESSNYSHYSLGNLKIQQHELREGRQPSRQ
jgi:hypothetical protein